MTTMNATTRHVRLEDIPYLAAGIAKVADRAEKLGLEPPRYEEIERRIVRPADEPPYTEVVVLIENPVVKLSGWTFLAELDHTREDVMIRSAVDEDLDLSKWPDSYCDWCRVNRFRNVTYLVRHEDGRELQVGSTCVKDMTGHRVNGFGPVLDFNVYGDDDDLDRSGPRWYDLLTYLTAVASTIRQVGWASKSKSDNPTCYLALDAWESGELDLADRDAELAESALEWARALDRPESNYLSNLRAIARSGFCRIKDLGFAASMVPAYEREMERQAKRARESESSSHLGDVGERLRNLRVRYTLCRAFDGFYGLRVLHKFETASGDVLVWWTHDFLTIDGQEVNHRDRPEIVLDGTVKAHETYNEVAQTVLSRCATRAIEQLTLC